MVAYNADIAVLEQVTIRIYRDSRFLTEPNRVKRFRFGVARAATIPGMSTLLESARIFVIIGTALLIVEQLLKVLRWYVGRVKLRKRTGRHVC